MTKIEWTDKTWNPTRGCTRVSEGCVNCYAERFAARMSGPGGAYAGFVKHTKAGPRWTGKVALIEEKLGEPLRWRKPCRVFVDSMSDLFHESLPDEVIDRVFDIMEDCPQHEFQILTKRPERMAQYLEGPSRGWTGAYLPQFIWLGTSVEDQATADERIPHLLRTPAAVRFLSCEPLLAPIDLRQYLGVGSVPPHHEVVRGILKSDWVPPLHWVIVGGESGPGARPMHPDWARAIRDQCQAAGVAFFFKQWGAWLAGENLGWPLARWQDGEVGQHSGAHYSDGRERDPGPEWRHFGTPGTLGAFALRVGKKAAGRLLDGCEWNEWPEQAA